MTCKNDEPRNKPVDTVDSGRRQALKTLGRAAYVAPAVAILPMEKLMAASSSTGCERSGGQGRGC